MTTSRGSEPQSSIYKGSGESASPRSRFNRTQCACDECVTCCRHLPGSLIQGDLELIAEHQGMGFVQGNQAGIDMEWLLEHFQASDGARILGMVEGQLAQLEVPAICPTLTEKGCIFLDDDGKCSIHEVAPFGCAFHDPHMTKEEADPRSQAAVSSQANAWANGDSYAAYWSVLKEHGKTAPSLKSRWDNLQQAFDELEMEG